MTRTIGKDDEITILNTYDETVTINLFDIRRLGVTEDEALELADALHDVVAHARSIRRLAAIRRFNNEGLACPDGNGFCDGSDVLHGAWCTRGSRVWIQGERAA